MPRKKEGTVQLHLNIELTQAEYKVFKSLGRPKEVIHKFLYGQMSEAEKCEHQIEKNDEIVRNVLQDNEELKRMADLCRRNVGAVDPELEEMRTKKLKDRMRQPFNEWDNTKIWNAVEDGKFRDQAELEAWVRKHQKIQEGG